MAEAETFGQRLERLLERESKEKAELARHLGVNQSNVTRWISGEHKPKIGHRKKIAEFLGVTTEELMYGRTAVAAEAKPESFRKRLARLMKEEEVTADDLAKAISEPQDTVNLWLQGNMPRADQTEKVAEYLNVSASYLLRGIERPEPPEVDAELISYATTKILDICDEQNFKPTPRQLGRLVGLVYKIIASANNRNGNGEADAKIRELIDFAMDGNRKENNNDKPAGPKTDQERSENQGTMKPISG